MRASPLYLEWRGRAGDAWRIRTGDSSHIYLEAAMGCAQWFERRVYMATWRIRLGVRSEALRAKGETRRQQEMKEGFGVQL